MANSILFRVRCETDGEVFVWSDTAPTECPNDGGHTIIPNCTAVIGRKQLRDLVFTMQNNGAVLNTGAQSAAYMEVPSDCEIVSCKLFGGPSGSIVVDVWSDTYANYPPTDADSIVAAAPPTISGGVKSEDTDLTGWTKQLSEGDGILLNIDSVSTMTWAKLVLEIARSR